ncbi:MAG: hypothetical protein SOY42_10085 [Clostridium sp.]|nr:hypothetical protein [Clostridium sp.]
MGIFSDAKDNYEKRQKAAEYRYDARKYINEGKEIYETAYNKLVSMSYDVQSEISNYVRFKKQKLNEMNDILKNLNCDEKNINSSALEIEFNHLEPSSVHAHTFVTGESFFDELGAIFSTIPAPSISDFFTDSTMDYYEAKSEREEAKFYKEAMKSERESLNNTREAMRSIKSYIYSEKKEIEKLVNILKKAATDECNEKDKLEAIYEITNLLAETLTTQFINNNYAITEQYNNVHSQIESINNNLYSAPVLSDVNWSNVRLLMR